MHEKSSIWPKLATLRGNYHVSAFCSIFQQKVGKGGPFREKERNIIDLAKSCNFSSKLLCFGVLVNFSAKRWKKWLISWKMTKNHRFGLNYATFRTNCHVLAFRWTFQEKVAESSSFREKARKNIDLAKTLQLFEQTTMSFHFDQLFRKKLQKVPQFVKKHEKSSIWPNLWNFSNKLQFLCISINFSGKSCKKYLISWKTTRNHRSRQKFATFRTNYHVFVFRWTFQKEVAKSASFREKAREIIDFTKTCNFSKKLPCFYVSMNFMAKTCKNCLISWKSTKNHRFGQNFASSGTNYHVFTFRSTFQKKLAKSSSFRDKTRKTMDLAKTGNFSSKPPCLGISMNFSERSCRNCLISWKSTRNHRFRKHYATFQSNYHVLVFRWTSQQKVAKSGSIREKAQKIIDLAKTLQLFEQTTMSLHFDQLFGKKLQKVPHFVKKHEKSLIWPKLWNFWNKLQCLFPFDELWRKKLQKVRRLVKKHEKSSILSTCNFPRKLPCFDVSMNIAAKSCKKLLVPWESTKNHQFGKIFATFRTDLDVFAFRWIFKEKLAKSASFREKARKIIDLAKTLQLFEQTTMFWHFDELFSKKLQKVPHFVKKHGKSSIWRKLATFPTNYHVLTLWWTFQREVAESASFSEKTLKIID